VDSEGQVRLFNDGNDHIFLTIRSQDNLLKPKTSGVYNIYGFCHEVGHMAMYRLIQNHDWLTGEAAEGWAHYLGSRLVDIVYKKEGKDLWPDKYDYVADGTKRLEKQLSVEKTSQIDKAAGIWKQLAGIVGDKNVAPIFKAWGEAKIDPADPAVEVGKTLAAKSSDQTLQWWNDAKELFVLKREKSKVAAETADEKKLTGKSTELKHDDGKKANKRSIAGGGHAVRFQVEGNSLFATEVKIYGERYGNPTPPKENFHVWICDKDFKVIADNELPFSKFSYATPRWVSLKIKPVKVPEEFIVCVGFNPTATKGVFVYYDGSESANSISGLPGEEINDFTDGNWMIRVSVSDKENKK
jgi:hypothetical protein